MVTASLNLRKTKPSPLITTMIMLCCAPPFDPTGRLPDGEYDVDWQELVERFGWNLRRRQLLDGLAEAVELLATAGCRRLWLNGSFVTAKEEPADFDACWDPDGVDLDVLDPCSWICRRVGRDKRSDSVANCSPTSPNRDRGWCSRSSFAMTETRFVRGSWC